MRKSPRPARFVDRLEPAVEFAIRLSGWSAIFFVFAIFFFIFREGAAFLWNRTEREFRTEEATGRPQIVYTEVPIEVPHDRFLERLVRAEEKGVIPAGIKTSFEVVGADEDGEGGHVNFVLTLPPGADAEKISADLTQEIRLREDYGHLITFLTSPNWRPPEASSNPEFGILALLVGSLCVTGLATLISVPLSLAAAIFVSEFSRGKTRETLKVVIELLAAFPSIVWGFIGYMILNPVIQQVTGRDLGLNILNGGIVLSFMSIPIIVSLAEDALKAVPETYREAAIALGATRWEVVWKVLLPAAKGGLLAAAMLGFGRCVGETMAVLMVTGHAINMPESIFDPVRTMTATIAAELGEAESGGGHYQALFLIGIVLMLFAFTFNLLADLVVRGVRGKTHA
jgi:phosphate transport system permease protein